MKSQKRIKYLFVARGPGETSQARALAKYIAERGGEVSFALHQEINRSFLQGDEKTFQIFVTKNPTELAEITKNRAPDVLLLFNSKMWSGYEDFFRAPPYRNSINICVDSNWFFNKEKYYLYPPIPWTDKYLVNIPKGIFTLGLKKNGGYFAIPPEMLKKIETIGIIPSYKKPQLKDRLSIRREYNIGKHEKLIFSYFSGSGAGHRTWVFDNLINAVDKLIANNFKIKVVYVGRQDDLDTKKLKRDWLILKKKLDIDKYYLTLAASDLVFQHQGLVTLSQSISAQVPVIANVSLFFGRALPKIHFGEVEPFAKRGVCKMLSKSTPVHKIEESIKTLLYDKKTITKMKNAQKKHSIPGEPRAYEIIEKLLNARKKLS